MFFHKRFQPIDYHALPCIFCCCCCCCCCFLNTFLFICSSVHYLRIIWTIFIICPSLFNGSMVYFIQSSQKSYNNKYNKKHMKEKMLDEDPAKREARSAESSALIEGRSRASYGLTRPDFVHHFSPRKPAL